MIRFSTSLVMPIPNVSEVSEPDWAELGHVDRATALLHDWVAAVQLRVVGGGGRWWWLGRVG